MRLPRNIGLQPLMLICRVAYLGLLACLVTTTALGMQPQLMGSALVEPESDSPGEVPGEEEIKSDNGIPVRRRGTVLTPTIEVRPVELVESHRSGKTPVLVSFRSPRGNRNGYGGPLRL